MLCIVAWTLQTILVGILICQPIELNWNPHARGTCGDQTIAFTSVAAVDIATDLMLMILPLKPLIALRIRTSHKIALCLIFCAGLITIVVTAVRLYFVYTLNFSDLSFSVVRNNYLNIIQPGIAVMVSCSPLLKPILDRMLALSPGAKHKSSSASSANKYDFTLQSVSRRLKGGNRLLLRSSHQATTGFSELSGSEQHLHVELGNIGTHEAKAMAEESPYPGNGLSNPDAWANDRILVTHQTVVQRDNC
ncbi:hypothetical protein F5Y02DRAFT_403156 [Annulohypoxylon stygium]|nr:hypothetical protein F5Y02DRAFT_403156 [Annulohypoxylon stygium]